MTWLVKLSSLIEWEKDPLYLKWICFMVQIRCYRSKNGSSVTSFKILNDMVDYTLLDLGNKILIVI